MGYGSYLKGLLAPLGVYDLTAGTLNGSELEAVGLGLDAVAARLEAAERESLTETAEGEGLDRREALFARKPAADTAAQRRAAIRALMQIDEGCFSPEAINRAISGCGIKAQAVEREPYGHIRILFPEVSGVPAEFEQIQKIVLDIIPCHLETEFYFRYMLWLECEQAGWTWRAVEDAGHTWHSFELAV